MPPDDNGPFPYGVASFEPTTSGVLLWTRTTSRDLSWEIALDRQFLRVVDGGAVEPPDEPTTSAGPEATREVEVQGLAPGTDHFYRFVIGGARSPVGRTRTLPEGDGPLRLGLVCCGDFSAGHFGVYRALAEADVDVVVHLGDYVYADPEGEARPTEPARDAVTREDYRARYRQVRIDPDLQALHQSHPMLSVIDDHDLTDNAHEFGAPNHDPETQGPWSARRDAAVAERRDWVPIRADGPEGRGRAEWRSVRLGSLGELVLLDTRLGGRSQPADAGEGPDLHDQTRTMLGAEQMRWATGRLAERSGPWAIVVSSLVMNAMELPLPGHKAGDLGLLPDGYLVRDGKAINTDAWDGYPADRARLVAAMRQRGSGVVVLSGDVHSSWAWEGPTDEGGPVAVELTCPAATSVPMGQAIPLVGPAVDRLVDHKHGVAWADLERHGYVTVDVTLTSVTGTWWFVEPEDPSASAIAGPSWTTHLERSGQLEEVTSTAAPADAADPAEPGEAGEPGRPSTRPGDRHLPVTLPSRPASVHAAGRRRDRRVRLLCAALGAAVVLWVQDRWAERRP